MFKISSPVAGNPYGGPVLVAAVEEYPDLAIDYDEAGWRVNPPSNFQTGRIVIQVWAGGRHVFRQALGSQCHRAGKG